MVIGKVGKFEHNIECLRLLQALEKENREPSEAERSALREYSGWGAIPDVFEQNPQGLWTQRKQELISVLGNEEEYNSLRNSVLTAYYTPPEFASRIWQAVERLGHKGGTVLEPAVGNGIFLETAPKDNVFTCVEKDNISAKIAQYTYPDANVYRSGYQEVLLPRASFDLAISNVPFGNMVPIEPKNVATPTVQRADKFNLHNFYFAKTMHGIKEDGLIAFVTSRYTMDSQTSSLRDRVGEHCDFVGAIRMPDKTFRSNAGTDVVSDVIFLQKRSPEKEMSELTRRFLKSGELEISGEKINVNQYYIDNPEMVIGKSEISNYRGKSLNVTIDREEEIYSCFDKLLDKLPRDIKKSVSQEAQSPVYLTNRADLVLDGDVMIKDKEIYLYDTDTKSYVKSELYDKLAELEIAGKNLSGVKKSANTRAKNKIKHTIEITPDFVKMRSLTNEMVQSTIMGDTLKVLETHKELNKLYDSFVKDHGYLHVKNNYDVFKQYSEFTKVTALEKWRKISKTGEKSELLSYVPKFEKSAVERADTLKDAFVLSLYNIGSIDVDYIHSLLPQEKYPDVRSIEMGLIGERLAFPDAKIYNETGVIRFELSDVSLSGNVREKYKEVVEAAGKNEEYFVEYRDAVERVIPKDLLPEEINIRLSSVALNNEYRQEFVRMELGDEKGDLRVDVLPTGEFKIVTDGIINTTMNRTVNAVNVRGNEGYKDYYCRGQDVLQQILNGSPTKEIKDTIKNPDGSETKKLNVPATKAFKEKMNEIEDKFKDWVFKEPERTEKICREYNDMMNSYVNAEYIHPLRRIDPQAQIRFPNSFFPHSARIHQSDAVHRVLTSRNTMLAHCVGAGKTYEMITSSMESKRLGISSKPLHVVPNHLLHQYTSDFYQMYPQANLLIADEDAVKPAQRQEFFNRMAGSGYDAIIIRQSSFTKLSMSLEYEKKFISEEIKNLRTYLESMNSEERNKDNPTFNDINSKIDKLEKKLMWRG